jgi:2-keto-3-deoxy-L-rhamnonate aldolase RhmA
VLGRARCVTAERNGRNVRADERIPFGVLVIALMIEKRESVEDLDAILSVKGIDMVQFGPSDYSMSLGLTGQRNHPDVLKAERKTIETALKMRLHPRVELGDITQAAPYLEMGVKHFCIGWDVRILYDWWRTDVMAARCH